MRFIASLRVLRSWTACCYGRLGFMNEFNDVFDGNLALIAGCFHGIRVHSDIFGTGDDKIINVAQGNRFANAVDAWSLLGVCLGHPDAPAAGSAAETILSAASHIRELQSQSFQYVARSIENAIVSPKIARVVIGDVIAKRVFNAQLPAFNQAVKQLGIMNYFVVAS